MSKASSNKISELKSLRKDGTSSKQLSQKDATSSKVLSQKDDISSKQLSQKGNENPKDDKISEIKSINKEMLDKEEENQSQNQVVDTATNKSKEKEKEEDKQSELMMKESLLNKSFAMENEINKEEQQKEDFTNNEKQSQMQEFTDKDKNTFKSAHEDHEANTKEELEKKRKKLLMTEVSNAFDNKDFFNFHDLIVPGGKNASLCLVNEPFNKNLRVTDIADHFKFIEPQQVIVLIGANTKRKIKLFAGISRAALNTRAIILDSGLQTGIEKFCLRKNITLIGIAPENKIEYPKINPEEFSNTLLTNGHTHFILLGKDDKTLNWGQEAKFKVNFAERLANGRKGAYQYKAKVVGVILGNIPNCVDECLMFMEKKWPLILVEDSDFCQFIKDSRYAPNDDEANKYGDKIALIGKYSKLIEIDDDSENLAASIHICLTLSF
jgi:hypothetical protein